MKTLTIKENDAGQRLDKFLSKHFKSMPLSLMYKYIRLKKIKVNGSRAHQDTVLAAGDVLTFYIPEEFTEEKKDLGFAYIKPAIDIVYEDENIIIVNKPDGMVCHPDSEESVNTVINHIKSYLYDKKEYVPENENSFTPALCNRIDRNTSGLVIAGKNHATVKLLNDKIKDREIDKRYLAVCHGKMSKPSGSISSFLEKDSVKNKVFIKQEKSGANIKDARLEYKVLDYKNSLSLLEIKLITGRTHQIRAQLASIGHPLLGDGKYAENKDDRKKGYKYQALCAYSMTFDFRSDSGHLEYLKKASFYAPSPGFLELFK